MHCRIQIWIQIKKKRCITIPPGWLHGALGLCLSFAISNFQSWGRAYKECESPLFVTSEDLVTLHLHWLMQSAHFVPMQHAGYYGVLVPGYVTTVLCMVSALPIIAVPSNMYFLIFFQSKLYNETRDWDNKTRPEATYEKCVKHITAEVVRRQEGECESERSWGKGLGVCTFWA